MSLKALFTADLHAHVWRSLARVLPSGMNSRLADLEHVLQELIVVMVAAGIKDAFVAGDLFHVKRHIPVQAIAVLYDAFEAGKKKGIRWHLIPGNHDKVGDSLRDISIACFRNIAEVYLEPTLDRERRIVYVPWMEDQGRVKRFLKDLRGDWQLLLYHGEVRGAYVGPTDYPIPLKSQIGLVDLFPERFELVMMGHLHRRQQLGTKGNWGDRVWYIGNPLPKDFGELEEDKGALTVVDRKVTIIRTKHPRFRIIDLSAVDLKFRRSDLQGVYRGDFVRFLVPAELSDREVSKAIELIEPREVEVFRLPREKPTVGSQRTMLELGQPLEELFDRYVDEAGEGDATFKEYGRKLLKG